MTAVVAPRGTGDYTAYCSHAPLAATPACNRRPHDNHSQIKTKQKKHARPNGRKAGCCRTEITRQHPGHNTSHQRQPTGSGWGAGACISWQRRTALLPPRASCDPARRPPLLWMHVPKHTSTSRAQHISTGGTRRSHRPHSRQHRVLSLLPVEDKLHAVELGAEGFDLSDHCVRQT